MNHVADEIKRTLSMRQVAEGYGYHPVRGSVIICPFHNEKTPSLVLYNEPGRGFHCFGCGKGGSVIDFVMLLFGLDFRQAIVRLNHDFGLGLTADRQDTRVVAKASKLLAERNQEQARKDAIFRFRSVCFRLLWVAYKTLAPKAPTDKFHPLYIRACHELPALEHWFEENI